MAEENEFDYGELHSGFQEEHIVMESTGVPAPNPQQYGGGSTIGGNAGSIYRSDPTRRGGRSTATNTGTSPVYRPPTVQENQRDLTLQDVKRLGEGIKNLFSGIRSLTEGQVDLPGTREDVINSKGVIDIEDEKIADDSIQLFFDDITNNKRLHIRASITNITETHNPEWIQHSYIGRPYPINQYKGVQRSLTFDFKMYAMNSAELPVIWDKLNYLTGLTHPAEYVGVGGANGMTTGFMAPPYVELTMGEVFNKIPGYLNSLNYTVPEGVSWDLNRQLPIGIDVNVGFTIIETRSHSNGRNSKYYGKTSGQDRNGLGSYLDDIGDAWNDLVGSFKGFGED